MVNLSIYIKSKMGISRYYKISRIMKKWLMYTKDFLLPLFIAILATAIVGWFLVFYFVVAIMEAITNSYLGI